MSARSSFQNKIFFLVFLCVRTNIMLWYLGFGIFQSRELLKFSAGDVVGITFES